MRWIQAQGPSKLALLEGGSAWAAGPTQCTRLPGSLLRPSPQLSRPFPQRRPQGLRQNGQVLDAERHPRERALGLASEVARLDRARLFARPLEAERRKGSEERIQLLDPDGERVHNLDRRERAPR